jgi:hypothetical protein
MSYVRSARPTVPTSRWRELCVRMTNKRATKEPAKTTINAIDYRHAIAVSDRLARYPFVSKVRFGSISEAPLSPGCQIECLVYNLDDSKTTYGDEAMATAFARLIEKVEMLAIEWPFFLLQQLPLELLLTPMFLNTYVRKGGHEFQGIQTA